MGFVDSFGGFVLDLFRLRKNRKPILRIHGQQSRSNVEPHQAIKLFLINRDGNYAMTLEEVYVESVSPLRIKVLQESTAGSGGYPDSWHPFSTSDIVNMILPSGQERGFIILFSSAGRAPARKDSIFLKISSSRPGIFHTTATPITLRIAVDADMRASIS
jgi:hypothetical protein